MKTFNNWREAVKFLWEEIKRNKPKEGANIQIETGKDGCKISASSENSGSGGSSYNGEFLIVKTDTGYSVINGADPESAFCGTVIAGSTQKQLAVFTTTNQTPNFWQKTTYVREGESESFTLEIVEEIYPTPAENEFYIHIGSASSSTGINQDWDEGTIYLSKYNLWLP